MGVRCSMGLPGGSEAEADVLTLSACREGFGHRQSPSQVSKWERHVVNWAVTARSEEVITGLNAALELRRLRG